MMRIEGILLPSDWDDDGQVTALILATPDEGELRIECHQAPTHLEKYLRQKVIVDGKIAGPGLLKIYTIKVCSPDLMSIGGWSNGSDGVREQTTL